MPSARGEDPDVLCETQRLALSRPPGVNPEYFVKMEFTLYGFDVYQAEVAPKANKALNLLVGRANQNLYRLLLSAASQDLCGLNIG
jgi:hypothetical protein